MKNNLKAYSPHLTENSSTKVSFSGFWRGFTPETFFLPLISQSLGRPSLEVNSSLAELEVESVFQRAKSWRTFSRDCIDFAQIRTRQPLRKGKSKKIWFTGENQRPPASEYDLTLSFDLDNYGGSNFYLPLILMSLNWFGLEYDKSSFEAKRAGSHLGPETVARSRESDIERRRGFACAILRNPEPTRLRAIEALSSVGVVDIFGPLAHRPVRSKFEIAKNYRFMLCFENDLYPGYVTEKPLDAWAAGCIPLWWGMDEAKLLNPDALVNLRTCDCLNDFVEKVAWLDSNLSEMLMMAREPLFSEIPTLAGAQEAIRKLFD